ncbi:MAG: hypothetical protein WA715_07540 [Candidatus Acidiferrum sp.]
MQEPSQDQPSDKDQVKEKHGCKGQNSCKGKGGCMASDNGRKGKNSTLIPASLARLGFLVGTASRSTGRT